MQEAEAGIDAGDSRSSEEHVNLLEELAHFCQNAGEFPTALEYYAQILDLADRASRSGDLLTQTAFKMAGCLQGTGEFDRALEMLDLAYRTCDGEADPIESARIRIERSKVYSRLGRYAEAEEDAREALAILQAKAISPELSEVFIAIGRIYLRTGDMVKAREAYEASLALCRALEDREGTARCYNNLALVSKNQGHLAEAAEFLHKALELARELGNKLQIGIRLNNLGIIQQKRGEWSAARECWEESLRIFRELGNKWETSLGYLNLAHSYRVSREWEKAEETYGRALQSATEKGHRRCEALYHEYFGELCLRRGEPERAETILTRGLEITREHLQKGGDVECEILRRRGEARVELNDRSGAMADLRSALLLARRLRDRFEEGTILRALGVLQTGRNRTGLAGKRLGRSMEILGAIGARYEQALTATAIGELALISDETDTGTIEILARASATFRDTGAVFEAARSDLVRADLLARRGNGLPAIELIEKIQRIIDDEGTEADRDRLREIRSRSDGLLVSTSVSESNTLSTFNLHLQRIQSIQESEERLRFALDLLRERTSAERILLILRDGKEGKLEIRETGGLPTKEWKETAEVGRMAMAYALSEGSGPIYSTGPSGDSRFDSGLAGLSRIGSLLAIPLGGEAEISGGIYLDRPVGAPSFGQGELDFAVALSSVVIGVLRELRNEEMRHENLLLKHRLGIGDGFERIVTQSPRLLKIIETLQKLRESTATILLQGETGTGKEMFARAIHKSSSRKEKLFVTVNCAELSEDVLESELFGHRKGAFTDAKAGRTGLFERANGGTVFIDEIDKASGRFQDALLRVVDRKEIKPVGSTESIRVDVRIICAANKDLREEVERDRFLKDLYYRLRVVAIYLPPLRDRREDVPILAEHFLSKHQKRTGRRLAGFRPEAMRLLIEYDWPGNVRDLEHEIERIVAVSSNGNPIGGEDLSPEITRNSDVAPGSKLSEVVERVERRLIEETLHRCDGNKSKTARQLGISRRGLLNKLERYRIR